MMEVLTYMVTNYFEENASFSSLKTKFNIVHFPILFRLIKPITQFK